MDDNQIPQEEVQVEPAAEPVVEPAPEVPVAEPQEPVGQVPGEVAPNQSRQW